MRPARRPARAPDDRQFGVAALFADEPSGVTVATFTGAANLSAARADPVVLANRLRAEAVWSRRYIASGKSAVGPKTGGTGTSSMRR